MRKIFFWLGTCFFSLSVSACFAYITPGVSGTWDFGPGYRTDHLKWSIAGPPPANFPNVLTEVDWRQLQIAQVNVRGHLTACDHVYARVNADWGIIMQGENNTTTFGANDQALQVSKFHSTANNGNVADLGGGLGVNFAPWRSGVEFAALIGYSFHQQRLRMENAIETFNINPAVLGAIEGLKTSFLGRWDGPWVGMDFTFRPMCRVRVETGFEYHWLRYRSRGLWAINTCVNPGANFLNNYRQDANGTGQTFFLGASYELSPGWAFGFYGNVENFHTHRGIHRSVFCIQSGVQNTCCGPNQISLQSVNNLPLVDTTVGTLPITTNTRLNPVHWHSFSLMFQFEARF